MAIFKAVILVLLATGLARGGQPSQIRPDGGVKCGNAKDGIPPAFYQAVIASVKPPEWKHPLISVTLVDERNVVLATDGKKFKLWSSAPDIPHATISEFLRDLDQSCRLPADPAEAARMLKTKWKSKELSAVEFNELHREFVTALTQYIANIPTRYHSIMKEGTVGVYVDTALYTVTYDNSENHVELEVWDDPKPAYQKALVRWLRKLKGPLDLPPQTAHE